MLNKFVCFYKNFRWECHAANAEDARAQAIKHFKVKPGKERTVDVRTAS